MTFREKLVSGQKVITAEITPPHGPDPLHFREKARELKSHFDALNVTDNQRALMRMSNLATAAMLVQEGVEPIYQLTCRDRNTIALQSDLLGASALGIPNVLCLTGDPVRAGHFEAKSVFEVESVGLLRMLGNLQNGKDSAGKDLDSKLNIFPGAVVNPSAKRVDGQIRRMEKKIEAGAQFFQTQAVFSATVFEEYAKQAAHLKVPTIAGVLIVQSLKTARFLQKKVPGVFVPDEMFEVLEKAEDPKKAGLEYAARLSRDLLGMCQGVHLMAIRDESVVIDVVNIGKLRS
ncbi:MAG: methylenetetrahydrofolate reductase [Bdellovibrionales bacterium]|nr:methylenetetrahydrofolate reductase [Bdellovibrionales bacterium]